MIELLCFPISIVSLSISLLCKKKFQTNGGFLCLIIFKTVLFKMFSLENSLFHSFPRETLYQGCTLRLRCHPYLMRPHVGKEQKRQTTNKQPCLIDYYNTIIVVLIDSSLSILLPPIKHQPCKNELQTNVP